MRPPSRSALAAALAIAFLATTLLPVVSADHAYSHRYIVFGRLVDEAGNPVQDKLVDVGVDPGLSPKIEGFCARQPDTQTEAWPETTTIQKTNQYGEFIWCFHMHSLPRSTDQRVRLRVDGVELDSAVVDTKARRNYLTGVVPGTSGTPSEEFNGTYLAMGRIMYFSTKENVEQISVYGDAFAHEPVQLKFTSADGTEVTDETRTNNYGDFAVRLNVSDPAGGKLTVTARGESFTYDADSTHRVTDATIELSDPDLLAKSLKKFGPLVILLGLVGGGAFFIFRGTNPKQTGKKAKR